MKKLLALALLLFLADCDGGGSSPPPVVAPPLPQPAPAAWQFVESPGMSSAAGYGQGGFIFQFPAADGVHYLLTGRGSPVSKIRMSWTIVATGGDPIFRYVKAADNNCSPDDFPATFTFYIQKAGGNWLDETARWFAGYARQTVAVGSGSVELSATEDWRDVYARTQAQTGVSLPSMAASAVGITFGGGCFAGHGAYVTGGTALMQADVFSVE